MTPDTATILLFLYGFCGALLVAMLGLILQVVILRRRVRRIENAFKTALDEEWRNPRGG